MSSLDKINNFSQQVNLKEQKELENSNTQLVLLNDFKLIIRMNIIGNNPVFGSDIGALKGKTVRRTPRQVIDDTIEIPHDLIQSQQNVKLCIDIIHVNGMLF
jgi:hypothetical protein